MILDRAALTAALIGLASASGPTIQCYPAYGGSVHSGPYGVDDFVSATIQETERVEVGCSPSGSNGCGSNGKKMVDRMATNHYNYQCFSADWCNDGGRGPATIHGGTAWRKTDKCNPDLATATNAPPAAWSGIGCPREYSSGTDYESGDVVSVKMPAYALVYQCVEGANSAFCGDSAYEPGESLHWDISWTALGSCSGTVGPTKSPTWDVLEDAGGCPAQYADGQDYEEGDRVSLRGLVFACRPFPMSGYCRMPGYRPMGEDGHPDAWKDAWDVTGYCSGTITPTASPSYISLEDLGGCPDEWVAGGADGSGYQEGDRISSGGLVFACKGWPRGAHCSQNGYKPDITCAEATCHWADAWSVIGHCDGSMGPTASPSFDPEGSVGGCPDEWTSGGDYEENDKVAVTISEDPLRQVVFKCKAWPYSGFCDQRAPLSFGGDQGWTFDGSCDGSIGPTASPVFDDMSVIQGGCPEEYSPSVTDYEDGDRVSVVISTVPRRAIVYKCRSWPHTAYCNQVHFRPGVSENYSMGWEVTGACSGSIAPTTSPIKYDGTCQYTPCNRGTYRVPCTEGSTGCGARCGSSCTKLVSGICDPARSPADVKLWSDSKRYEEGDVVRVDRMRYKCRPHPNTGWCSVSAYKPTGHSSGLWSQAWIMDGKCHTALPTLGPTAGPSAGPTTAGPTAGPTFCPTGNTCFETYADLIDAIESYEELESNCCADSACAMYKATYGHPMNSWCFSSGLTDMSFLFMGETFNSDISSWDVSSVTNMGAMFIGASSFNQDLSSWNVGNVVNLGSMFKDASSFNSDLSSWDVSSATSIDSMFQGASSFNQDLSSWNVGNVVKLRKMFKDASSFNSDLSSWDVSSATSIHSMFQGASSFNQDISGWNVGKAVSMANMFYGASKFNQDLSSWDISSAKFMTYMLNSAIVFNQDLCAWGSHASFLSASKIGIFAGSGCNTTATPTDSTGPICGSSTCN